MRLSRGVVSTVALGAVVAGCGVDTQAPTTDTGQTDTVAVPQASTAADPADVSNAARESGSSSDQNAAALAALTVLPVKGRAPKTGYSRDQFGPAWSDDVNVALGHNGCDTRNDILRRDLTSVALKPGTRGCVVRSGTLTDPYTATTIAFVRGSGTSTVVQIDHVVPLSDAWQTGAQQLDAGRRRDFANDPRNLQATDGKTNEQKSDGDAATWLPPSKSYRCTYVARQVDVKRAYGLWVTPAERDAIARVLHSCGAAGVTTETSVTTTTSTYVPPPTTTPTTQLPRPLIPTTTDEPAPVAPAVGDGGATYYANCAAARAAGAAPIRLGEPGYSSKLDRDGDGIACESK